MSDNPYVDFCLMVQAVRRECECLRTPLAPAMGVAGSIYTHQIANIQRVLTDVRVRHLLADEVGLGKTVQALMILNALKIQRPDLKALVIVPDRLVPQWRDEILTRAHTAPFGDEEEFEGTQYIRLAWEGQLRPTDADTDATWALSDINSKNYDVLIVDELHRLRSDVQDRIVRVAPAFQHLLVLTATPAFQRIDRHAQLFAMLEPERSAIARWGATLSDEGSRVELSMSDDLSSWPEWAIGSVVTSLLERDRLAEEACPDDNEAHEAAAITHCAYRRVIRTRRIDYGRVLPQRRHIPIVTEPLGAEVERQTLMWRYFDYLPQLTRKFEPVALAKRVILSPPSLEQRVDFLRREGHERAGLLEQVKPLVHGSRGDSRLDTLVDLLAEIWRLDPTERVLVAAQDNLTVDYLFDLVRARLPIIGPPDAEIPLVAARLRQGQGTDPLDDLGGFENETAENLEDFQRGDALVLFAPEAAQAGLNLQCARILVLYSVPWRPEEVEQWIGRLDRIGNAAAFSINGEAKSVNVYTIAQRGLVDEKVVAVLQKFHVFEHSVNLDGDHLEEVSKRIEAAALQPDNVSWETIEDDTETMAFEDEGQELDSGLRQWLPWTVDWARSLHDRIDKMEPIAPILVELSEYSQTGPRSWDRALEGFIKLLGRAAEYNIRSNYDEEGGRFRTLWYRFAQLGMAGQAREVLSRIVLSFGADPSQERHPRHAHAFIMRRGEIGTPPRREVTLHLEDISVRRNLRFLNFGDPLHDELVSGWAQYDNTERVIDVKLHEDHALFASGSEGLYLVRFSILDPSSMLTNHNTLGRAREDMANAMLSSSPERRVEFLRPLIYQLQCQLDADVRWLRAELPAEFRIDGLVHADGERSRADPNVLMFLLNPMAQSKKVLPRSSHRKLSPEWEKRVAGGFVILCKGDKTISNTIYSYRFPAFDRALRLRITAVQEEAENANKLVMLEQESADRRLHMVRTRGNPGQITLAEANHKASLDVLNATREMWKSRLAWLNLCSTAIQELEPIERAKTVINVRRIKTNNL